MINKISDNLEATTLYGNFFDNATYLRIQQTNDFLDVCKKMEAVIKMNSDNDYFGIPKIDYQYTDPANFISYINKNTINSDFKIRNEIIFESEKFIKDGISKIEDILKPLSEDGKEKLGGRSELNELNSNPIKGLISTIAKLILFIECLQSNEIIKKDKIINNTKNKLGNAFSNPDALTENLESSLNYQINRFDYIYYKFGSWFEELKKSELVKIGIL